MFDGVIRWQTFTEPFRRFDHLIEVIPVTGCKKGIQMMLEYIVGKIGEYIRTGRNINIEIGPFASTTKQTHSLTEALEPGVTFYMT